MPGWARRRPGLAAAAAAAAAGCRRSSLATLTVTLRCTRAAVHRWRRCAWSRSRPRATPMEPAGLGSGGWAAWCISSAPRHRCSPMLACEPVLPSAPYDLQAAGERPGAPTACHQHPRAAGAAEGAGKGAGRNPGERAHGEPQPHAALARAPGARACRGAGWGGRMPEHRPRMLAAADAPRGARPPARPPARLPLLAHLCRTFGHGPSSRRRGRA